MVVFHCVGCRAQYREARAPRRCDRCHGKAFAAVDDAVDLEAVEIRRLYAEDAKRLGVTGVTPLSSDDADLAAAFAEAERFRQSALAGRPYEAPAPPVAPEPASVPAMTFPTNDAPAWAAEKVDAMKRGELPPFGPAVVVIEGEPSDDAPATPRDMPEQD